MAMSGAYIAMVMAESSAANAFALGALNGQVLARSSQGGKINQEHLYM